MRYAMYGKHLRSGTVNVLEVSNERRDLCAVRDWYNKRHSDWVFFVTEVNPVVSLDRR